MRLPDQAEALRRIDRNSGLSHRPATAVSDHLAVTQSDPMSAALWQAHIERALRAARNLRAGWPMPQLAARDPFALRALVAVLLIATFFSAGGDRYRRIAAAFNWQGFTTPANYRIDAWVTPPPYTARPPVILPGLRPGENARAASTGRRSGRIDPRDPRNRIERTRYRREGRPQGRESGQSRACSGRHA